jgi:hypothetical protein
LPLVKPGQLSGFWPLNAIYPSNLLFLPASPDGIARRDVFMAVDLKRSSSTPWVKLRSRGWTGDAPAVEHDPAYEPIEDTAEDDDEDEDEGRSALHEDVLAAVDMDEE